MKYKIYKLVYNGEVIYIGCTKQKYLSTRKAQKYKIPIEIKKESSIELIEETDDKSREEYWRKYYEDLGCDLYNIKKGFTGLLTKKDQYKEWCNNNRDKIKERCDNNKEKLNEYSKQWRDNNKEYIKEWRDNNKEKIKAQRKEYYENNKEKFNKKIKI